MSIQTLPPRMQDRLYHDLMLPEEAQEIRAEVRQFSEKELAPIAHDIGQQEEAGENFPHELFIKMARADLFRIPFSKENGGRDLHYPACATVVTIEELAYPLWEEAQHYVAESIGEDKSNLIVKDLSDMVSMLRKR